jgi:hypothetical protein
MSVVYRIQRPAWLNFQKPGFLETDGNARLDDQRFLICCGLLLKRLKDDFKCKWLNLHLYILPHLVVPLQKTPSALPPRHSVIHTLLKRRFGTLGILHLYILI